MGTACTSEQGEGGKISVSVPPAMPACRLHSRGNPQGSGAGRGCPSAHPCLLPILHLLTSLTPSGKEQCPSAYLSGLLGGLREPVGKKAVCKQPVALQPPGERTSLSPSRWGPWTSSSSRSRLGSVRMQNSLLSVTRPLLPLPQGRIGLPSVFKLPQLGWQVKMLKGGLDSPPPPSALWPLLST